MLTIGLRYSKILLVRDSPYRLYKSRLGGQTNGKVL